MLQLAQRMPTLSGRVKHFKCEREGMDGKTLLNEGTALIYGHRRAPHRSGLLATEFRLRETRH